MRKTSKAVPRFVPSSYKLTIDSSGGALTLLEIVGERFGPPSKRLIFNQKGLRVKSAKVVHKGKNKVIEHEVIRINHLPSFEQVRLHTSALLYPGSYMISLEFSSKRLHEVDESEISQPDRELFPAIDESDTQTVIEVKRA
ncbi:MAG: hypothetical protein JWO96_181 [Candidatus Saccharibacteria bacterium]|nr:hypothetical protein [Candidatus Saccharibacteria bacterium]